MRNFRVLIQAPPNQMAWLAAAEELLPEFMEETGPIVRKAIDYASKAAAAREVYRDVKGVGKRVGKSFQGARKMARTYNPFTRRGRAGIGSLERRAGFRKAKRPPKRVARRVSPKAFFPVAKTMKKFKKSRKPLNDKGKYVSRNYDDYGTMERDHSWWMGFQTHGSRGRLFDILAEALTKAVLAKLRIYPRSYNEDISTHDYVQAVPFFTRVLNNGVDEPVGGSAITLHGRTFEQVCADFRTEIANQANGDPSTGPSTDTVARYCYKIQLLNADPSKAFMEIRDVGDSIVDIKVTQKIRFQNVTKNIDGTNDIDQAGLNPLRGRKYEFANFRPRLIDSIQQLPDRTNEAGVAYNYDSFMITDAVLAGAEGITPMPATGSMAKDDPISHPPIAKQLFSNCKASSPVSLGAGAMKVEYTTFRMVHKMKTLIERIYWSSFDKGAFGGSVWYGFEKAFRQAKPSGVTNDDRIALGFNREVHMYAKVKLVAQKSMLKHYDAVDMGLIAAA